MRNACSVHERRSAKKSPPGGSERARGIPMTGALTSPGEVAGKLQAPGGAKKQRVMRLDDAARGGDPFGQLLQRGALFARFVAGCGLDVGRTPILARKPVMCKLGSKRLHNPSLSPNLAAKPSRR